jgi:phosphatidylglycerophosphate synthase
MFDARLRRVIDPALVGLAKALSNTRISANALTLLGIPIAVAAAYAIYQHTFFAALLLIAANRLLDGLDGMVARIKGPTPLGGYLDILADFAFYVAIPIAFGLSDPENLSAALLLVGAFTLTGVSFLAYASVAANVGIQESEHGPKGFLYTTGLMEGGETIFFFVVMCAFPKWFIPLALIFTALCLLTVFQRSWLAWRTLR